ncbi:hypothetical protein [Flavonifractor sp. AGMB03687]|uniref:hypothetical protein n=1 Tax=Flavonifractor sp. AGMB03687 TaxID=2785133 RepID=UPI001ADEC035|nr:hypothetical protein [Flavonifractor sp. AGMB03687]
MKDAFMASLFHKGVHGGALYLQRDNVLYRTNKSLLEAEYRSLELPYHRIETVKTGWALCFPTVTFSMKNGVSYRFLVFRRKTFLSRYHVLAGGAR